ncbi:DUF2510 domain-containing protein [Kitasatospora sp. NPDC059747]|uniref:DUF2510 domain-containing protein n=1 Tax=Kitasatospora sp. NPDC059747 TaxID=3346930 RepID=UPI003651C653
MSEQIPAGWYPDPKDTSSDPRPQRWWDGKGWTASTRPAPSDAPTPEPPAADAPGPGTAEEPAAAAGGPTVLEGEVLESGTVRYPEPPPFGTAYGAEVPPPAKARRKPSKLVVATVVAALVGLGVGSGVTYLAMDGHGDRTQRVAKPQAAPWENGPWNDFPGLGGGSGGPGGGGSGGNGGGNGKGGSGGNGSGGSGGSGGNGKTRPGSGGAIDLVNRITLPVPSGWDAGSTRDGFASMSVGTYTCAGGGTGTCTLGGVNTGHIDGATDVQAAAKSDITQAAKDAYGDITGHQELKSEAVTVNGKSGYLVRWKVDAPTGNNGYVQTVVFPSADGTGLVSVHFGFDIADKAPDPAVMDTIVKGIGDYKGKLPSIPLPGGGTGGAGGAGGSGSTGGSGDPGTGGTTTTAT